MRYVTSGNICKVRPRWPEPGSSVAAKGEARELHCPRCRTRQYGSVARCSNCSKDLLYGRSPRMRYYAFLASVFSLLVAMGMVLGAEQLPFAYPLIALGLLMAGSTAAVAAIPASAASRYQRRALANLRDNPELALLDLTRAIELDANDRSLLVDRARVLRLLGQHRAAAADLQTYLRRTRGEPPQRVDQARMLLQRVESSGGLGMWEI